MLMSLPIVEFTHRLPDCGCAFDPRPVVNHHPRSSPTLNSTLTLEMHSLSVLAFWGVFCACPVKGCLDLAGILSGGGDGVLDLDVVSVTVEKEPFDLSLAPLPTVAVCSAGIETPISMRNLLGGCEFMRGYGASKFDSLRLPTLVPFVNHPDSIVGLSSSVSRSGAVCR